MSLDPNGVTAVADLIRESSDLSPDDATQAAVGLLATYYSAAAPDPQYARARQVLSDIDDVLREGLETWPKIPSRLEFYRWCLEERKRLATEEITQDRDLWKVAAENLARKLTEAEDRIERFDPKLRAENARLRRVLDRFSDAVSELLQVGPFTSYQQANVAAVRAEFDAVNST